MRHSFVSVLCLQFNALFRQTPLVFASKRHRLCRVGGCSPRLWENGLFAHAAVWLERLREAHRFSEPVLGTRLGDRSGSARRPGLPQYHGAVWLGAFLACAAFAHREVPHRWERRETRCWNHGRRHGWGMPLPHCCCHEWGRRLSPLRKRPG